MLRNRIYLTTKKNTKSTIIYYLLIFPFPFAQMVPGPWSNAHFQRIHARHWYMECWMCTCRDVKWEATLPWQRLCVLPASTQMPYLVVNSLVFLDHDQLSIILDILGTPSIDDFYAITSQRSREYIRALPFRKKKSFQALFPGANPLVSVVSPHFVSGQGSWLLLTNESYK